MNLEFERQKPVNDQYRENYERVFGKRTKVVDDNPKKYINESNAPTR